MFLQNADIIRQLPNIDVKPAIAREGVEGRERHMANSVIRFVWLSAKAAICF